MTDTFAAPVVFETADPEAADEFMKQAYADAPTIRVVGPLSGGPVCSFRQRAAGPVALAEVTTEPELSGRIEPGDLLTLEVIHSGTIEIDAPDGPERYAAGDVLAAIGPGMSYRCTTKGLSVSVLMLPASLAAETAALPDATARPWRLLARGPVDETAAGLWRDTNAYLDQLLDDPDTAASPLLAGTAARMAAAAALAAFPTTLTAEPALTDGADATPDTVRRAVAFIEANADRDIGPADIAAAAYVTPRALQYAFRRHLDTTPLAHLRRVRLDAAHAELLAADPRTTTVTRIAARWGFDHHFSGLYRDAYRTSPSTTLHRAA